MDLDDRVSAADVRLPRPASDTGGPLGAYGEPEGCDCATGTVGALPAWLVLLGVGWVRRRRVAFRFEC